MNYGAAESWCEMPRSNAEKIDECLEIIGKGVFSRWEQTFLKNLREKLLAPLFRPSPKQQAKIDELYETACKSPY